MHIDQILFSPLDPHNPDWKVVLRKEVRSKRIVVHDIEQEVDEGFLFVGTNNDSLDYGVLRTLIIQFPPIPRGGRTISLASILVEKRNFEVVEQGKCPPWPIIEDEPSEIEILVQYISYFWYVTYSPHLPRILNFIIENCCFVCLYLLNHDVQTKCRMEF